jgi:hypothetical protein
MDCRDLKEGCRGSRAKEWNATAGVVGSFGFDHVDDNRVRRVKVVYSAHSFRMGVISGGFVVAKWRYRGVIV